MKLSQAVVLALGVGCMAPPLLAGGNSVKPDDSITYQGLSGLFNLVTPDTLNRSQVSFGVLSRNYDRQLTNIDVNDVAAALAIGLSNRLEVGASFIVNRQVDYDDLGTLGFYNGLPFGTRTIDNGIGDMTIGIKYAIARMESGPGGLALFAQVKAPVGDSSTGHGTKGWDETIGLAAGYAPGQVGLFGSASYTLTGDAKVAGVAVLDLADVFRWGAGLELGARSWIKGIVEVSGESFVSEDKSLPIPQESAVDLTLGFKLGRRHGRGVTFGAAWVRNLTMDRTIAGGPSRPDGWIAELSWTSAPPLPPPPPSVVPQAKENHAPTCSLTVTPTQVYPSFSTKTNFATVSALASDPNGDTLSYAWSTSGGRIDGSGASVTWNPPDQAEDGTFSVSARVSDGHGGEAECSASLSVRPDPEYFDGRVQFEFDRYDLTPEAQDVLRRAADHLRRYADLKLSVEGHTCYIATDEYNMALGQHRAESIRTQLVVLGVDSARLSSISYGESKPWKDNGQELTRRLNRRGEFRFKFSQ